MINPFTEINWNPDKAQTRQFGPAAIIGLGVIAVALVAVRRFFFGDDSLLFPACLFTAGILIFSITRQAAFIETA